MAYISDYDLKTLRERNAALEARALQMEEQAFAIARQRDALEAKRKEDVRKCADICGRLNSGYASWAAIRAAFPEVFHNE